MVKTVKPLNFVDADERDCVLLTETAISSKRYWGYSSELMALWEDELQITPSYVASNIVIKAIADNTLVGFFALKKGGGNTAEIDHLWIVPGEIGKGYGRQIFNHLKQILGSHGISAVTLVAEPNARGFYEKMGGTVAGTTKSGIQGRWLDIYEFRF